MASGFCRRWDLSSRSIDRFDVELNIGELMVVGPLGEEKDSIGGRYFRSGEPPVESERVLVIRVADIEKIEPVRSKDF